MSTHSITAEEYARVVAKVYEPDLDWDKPAEYDLTDREEMTATAEKVLALLAWSGFIVQRLDDLALDEFDPSPSLEAVKAETTTEWNAVRQDATGELWDVYEPFDSREDAERVAAEWRSNNEPGDDPVVVVERTKGVAPGEWQIVTSEVNRG